MAQKTKHNSPLALTYAQSLLDLEWEKNQAVDIGKELEGLSAIFDAQPAFAEYLADPGISQEERAASIDKIFRGRVSELVLSFLGVLNLHSRLRLIENTFAAYGDLLDDRLGNVEVDVTTAQRLSAEELDQVRQRVGRAIGKNAIVHQYVDDGIIGGLVIRVGDRVIDASVKQQLMSLRDRLLSGSTDLKSN